MTSGSCAPVDGVRRLILASASPRRASLLRKYGYEFEVVAPPLGEPAPAAGGLAPEQSAEALSYYKACSVAELTGSGVILAGDTVVSLNAEVFGQPTDRDDARRILRALAGTTQRVITGVTLLDAVTRERRIAHDSTAVTMRPVTDAELEAYLDTGAWAGKAGAYGIQDRGDAFVTKVEGSFTNVVGLPMELLARMLDDFGFTPPRPRPATQQDSTSRNQRA